MTVLDALPLTPNGKVDRRALALVHDPERVRLLCELLAGMDDENGAAG